MFNPYTPGRCYDLRGPGGCGQQFPQNNCCGPQFPQNNCCGPQPYPPPFPPQPPFNPCALNISIPYTYIFFLAGLAIGRKCCD